MKKYKKNLIQLQSMNFKITKVNILLKTFKYKMKQKSKLINNYYFQ